MRRERERESEGTREEREGPRKQERAGEESKEIEQNHFANCLAQNQQPLISSRQSSGPGSSSVPTAPLP